MATIVASSDGNQATRCLYCHDLQPEEERDEYMPYPEWAQGILSSSCSQCQILRSAIERTQAQILTRWKSQPDTLICVNVKPNGLIFFYNQREGWHSLFGTLQLCSTDNSQPRIGDAQGFWDIASHSAEDSVWSFLETCITACTGTHARCRRNAEPGWFPQRLLMLDEDAEKRASIKLVDTHTHTPESPYITLSHCWGNSGPLQTTTSNIDSFQVGINIGELPQTFRDFVTVARRLGIRYLWIDALCIIQDHRSDWARHSCVMDRVYQNALFTVAACVSSDSSTPFLGPDAPNLRSVSESKAIQCCGREFKARNTDKLRFSTLWDGPLEKRGWAWQERSLSTRTINFLESQVVWSCKTACFQEHGLILERDQEPNMALGDDMAQTPELPESLPARLRKWQTIVSDYSRRDLTYATDRLPALSGMASKFQEGQAMSYLAGLWKENFPMCLGWYRRELSDADLNPKPVMTPSLSNGVPTWSWASIQQQIFWLIPHSPMLAASAGSSDGQPSSADVRSRVELVSSHCEPCTNNPFGEVSPMSYLELRGKVIEAEIECDIHGSGLVRCSGARPQLIVPDCVLLSSTNTRYLQPATWFKKSSEQVRRAGPEDEFKQERTTGAVVCLLLYTIQEAEKTSACVLILSRSSQDREYYQRVGIGPPSTALGPAYSYRKSWHVWKDWEDLEKWDEWESLFTNAATETLRII